MCLEYLLIDLISCFENNNFLFNDLNYKQLEQFTDSHSCVQIDTCNYSELLDIVYPKLFR